MMPASCFDLVVIGGGPAGLAAAISAARAGLAVLLAERTAYDCVRIGEHLPPNAKALLGALGMGALLRDGRHASCPGIRSVWGTSEPTETDYLFNPHGAGVNLFRPEFDHSLARAAGAVGVSVATNTKVLEVRRCSGMWEIPVLCDGKRRDLRATFVVDATGRRASFAKRIGARPIVYDQLIGIFARSGPGYADDRLVHIEAQEAGWWYSAGLGDRSLVVCFMTDADLADVSGARKASMWQRQLADATLTRQRVDLHTSLTGLRICSARTHRLDAVAGDGWLAVGDAAMSVDPLSSDGLAKAFETGMHAGSVAEAWCRGDRSSLRAYEQDVEKRFARYLEERQRYYVAEKRWRHAEFWRRRHSAAALAAL